MNQSTVIAGTLLGGFILFLASQNRLSAYSAVLWGAAPPAATLATSGTPSQQGISSALFGASGPTTPSLNPIAGTLNAIGSIFGF